MPGAGLILVYILPVAGAPVQIFASVAPASLAAPGAVYAALVLLGLVFGSFANVLIWRLPRGEEVVKAGSHCPHCDAKIHWFDNIPIISFLLLRAKCRACHARISPRYPVVEAASAVIFVATYALARGAGYDAAGAALIIACTYILFVIFVVDVETYLIPDQLVWWGIVISAALFAIGQSPAKGWQAALIGYFSLSLLLVIVGMIANAIVFPETYKKEGGPLVVFSWLWYLLVYPVVYPYEHFSGKNKASADEVLDSESAAAEENAMGGGDIKLAAFMGLLLGWKLVIAAFAFAILWGGFLAAIMMVVRRVSGRYERGLKLQFGPFLAIGCFFAIFWGERLIAWYLRLTGIAG